MEQPLSSPPATFFESLFVEVLAGYVGAAATKSVMLGTIILVTARLFVSFEIQHPFAMFGFLILTSVTFSLLGFAIGIWADSWEKTSIVPMMIVTPLTFLGGSFYSLSMLPPVWQKLTLFNPVVYLINGFRWSFYGKSDVNVVLSVSMTVLFMLICLSLIAWMFKTGYKLKN